MTIIKKSIFLFFLFFLFLVSIKLYGQPSIIEEEDIPKLDSVIHLLEKEYELAEPSAYYSFPQTTANYFEIITTEPDRFIRELEQSKNLRQLQNKFQGLQVDQDLLIIKFIYINYKDERMIELKSFEIENNGSHSIKLAYTDSLNQSNLEYYYALKTRKKEDRTTISGFFLNNVFKSIPIPATYADWINYTDILVRPETSLYYDYNTKPTRYSPTEKTLIDSLIISFQSKTNRPKYKKEQDYKSRMEELNEYASHQEEYADSLYRHDVDFKDLLHAALLYAEENSITAAYLEDFTAQLISKESALELMRQKRPFGKCSQDESPLNQLKRMAHLAAQIPNWEVFIRSFLNLMNDQVLRFANTNFATNARKTYIEELIKLDLDIDKILMGSNLKIEVQDRNHYFSNGNKVAKAYANLNPERQAFFEKTISQLLLDKEVDAFNKLHFYNTFRSYAYFAKDSIKRKEVNEIIDQLIPFLPFEIKSRIQEPNKQLHHLLHKEKEALDRFEVLSSDIANISSYSYDGYCWLAELVEKDSKGKIIYDLAMSIGEEVTPLQNFLDQKDELTTRVIEHPFLQEIVTTNEENRIYINFTDDRSFVNNRNKVTRELPDELVSKLDFDQAISLSVSFPKRKYVRFVLFRNGDLLLMNIPKGFELPGYSFEDLKTSEEKAFFSTTYTSNKLFNKEGQLLN